MRVLISGAGIAGLTLGWWLHRYGFRPTIVEKSPVLRAGGYVIDFWGAGYEIAERMRLLPRLQQVGYRVKEVRIVNTEGNRISGFRTDVFWRMTGGNFISLGRGDLAAAIFDLVDGRVEKLFGDSIRSIFQHDNTVSVEFESGLQREFDLIIGADGLHSRVRELVFGPSARYEKYLGCKVAAFTAADYQPRDELVYVMYTQVRGQVARFSMRENRTMFLFIFADDDPEIGTLADQRSVLHTCFGKSGWECRKILNALDAAEQVYFDRVSQVRMGSGGGCWHRDRVALLGDAASCISFLGGQGSALAMTAAYLLAGELCRCRGDYRAAFLAYEQRFAPFVSRKQKAALSFAGVFVPRSQVSIFFRNLIMRMMNWNLVANAVVRGDLADRLQLPDFERLDSFAI
jgi:2-polyprenyl-6-methoxyphenol hydroxylase-like FAD-dependent oxidoreductase